VAVLMISAMVYLDRITGFLSQLVGIVTDMTIANPQAVSLAQSLSLAPDQLGMKLGMLVGMLFPLAGVFLYWRIWKKAKKN